MLDAVELIQDLQICCLAVVFGCMVLGNRSDRVLRLIWYSFLVFGIGSVIELCTAHLPRWLAYGLDYETPPISYSLLNLAIATFVGRGQCTRWISAALFAVSLPSFLYWSGSSPAQLQSVALMDFLIATQTGCSAWVLLRSRERATALSRYTLAAFFGFFSAVGMYRSVVVAVFHVPPGTFVPAVEIVTVSIYVMAVSILPLNLVWMMNARMRQELRSESLRDPLTNLLNRRGFAEAAQRELARYWRGSQDFAVAIADIDHFKRMNDTHGHSCGDEVLCHVGRFFTDELRQSDLVSRSGGEEFTFLLPVTSASEMFAVLDRIRLSLERRVIVIDANLNVSATISIGVTNSRGRRGQGLEELLLEADKALYAAKRAGRNRTVCFSEIAGLEAAAVADAISAPLTPA